MTHKIQYKMHTKYKYDQKIFYDILWYNIKSIQNTSIIKKYFMIFYNTQNTIENPHKMQVW